MVCIILYKIVSLCIEVAVRKNACVYKSTARLEA